jgi:hypothetical protein
MVRHNSTLLNVVVVCVLNVVNAKVVKDTYTDNVEEQNAARFRDIRYFDRVKTENDRLTSTEYTSEHTNVVRELLGRVCECANPVVYDVVPKLGEDPVEHEEHKDPAKSRLIPIRGDGRGIVAIVVTCANLIIVSLL